MEGTGELPQVCGPPLSVTTATDAKTGDEVEEALPSDGEGTAKAEPDETVHPDGPDEECVFCPCRENLKMHGALNVLFCENCFGKVKIKGDKGANYNEDGSGEECTMCPCRENLKMHPVLNVWLCEDCYGKFKIIGDKGANSSGGMMRYGIIGGVVAGGLALVAAPVVVPAAVGMLGFTATGIAGGSTAASMMSAAAIANGGGVAAGSAVAVMQSVGAAGLGLQGALTTGAVGSAVGGAVGAVTGYFKKK